MNIQITVNNFELTDSMRTIIDERLKIHLEKLLTHLPEDEKRAQMHISFEKKPEIFKVNFSMNHLFSETEHINFESAIVDLREQLERQIERKKHEPTL